MYGRSRASFTTWCGAALLAWAVPGTSTVRAAHYSGGSITYECLGGNQYLFHLDLFLDCAGFQMVPQALDFQSDCGTQFTLANLAVPPGEEVSQLCPSALPNSTCNGGAEPGIMHYQFDVAVFLAPCDSWTVSWDICCRNNTINVAGLPGIYIEATVNTLGAPCDNSPVFTDQSLPYVCVNQQVDYNFGVTEPDGDSLVYTLVDAQQMVPPPSPVTYNAGYSGAAPIPGITLDPVTGQLTFTPTLIGNYVVAVEVAQYDANGNLIGTVMRDILFVVMNCANAAPTVSGLVNNTGGTITGTNSIQVCEGEPFCVDLVFTDTDPGTVLQVTSQAAALLPGSTVTVTGADPAVVTLCWTGDPANSPVNVLFEGSDGTCPIMNTVLTAVNIISVPGGAMPDPGLDSSLPLCAGGGAVSLFNALGGTPDPGGSWTGPGGTPHPATFDPLTDAPGAYTYTVGNACAYVDASVTVSIAAPPDAGSNGNLSVCSNAPAVSLASALGGTPDPGGAWSGPSVVVGGAYDPSTMVPGAYTYTVTGTAPCPNATATVTVTEQPAPDAGGNGSLATCSTGAAASLFAQLSGTPSAGGAWSGPSPVVGGQYDPATMAPGAYSYTVTGTAPCANASATVNVSESAAPSAGGNGTLTVCSTGAAVSLAAQLAGTPDPGGAWSGPSPVIAGLYDPATMVPGVYTYAVTGTAPCPSASATVTVTEPQAPGAGTSGTLTLCSTSAAVSLLAQLGGSPDPGGTWSGPSVVVGGLYDPSTMSAGSYTYTVNGAAPCANASATVTVTEPQAPDAGSSGTLSICSAGLPVSLLAQLGGTPDPGGAWSGPSAAVGGQYDPAVMNPGVYTYTVNGTAPCANASATVTVTENAAAYAGADASFALCGNDPAADLFALLGPGAQAGGTWSGPSPVVNGLYDPATMAPGVYDYLVQAPAPCGSDQASITVAEAAAPFAGVDAAVTICDIGGTVDLFALLGAAQVGGTWTAPGGAAFSGAYDPAINGSGAYTYTVSGTAPCPADQAVVDVVETSSPFAGNDAATAVCSNGTPIDLFTLLGAAQPGGTWTAPGGATFSGTYDPGVDAPGVYTYLINATAPCVSDQATVTVAEPAAPNAGNDGAITVCEQGIPVNLSTALAGAQAGGTWTGPGGVAFSGLYDPALDGPGVYTYTVAGAAPCASDQSTVTVSEAAAPYAGSDALITICSTVAPVNLFNLLGGAQAGGTWSGPLGAFSGLYDPAIDASGTYTYALAANPPCAADQATVIVTEETAPDAGQNTVLTVCSGAPALSLFAQLGGTPNSGGTWTDPLGAASNGTFDPSVAMPGTYTYVVNGVICPADQATVTVNVDPGPDAGLDGALDLCADGAVAALSSALGGSPDANGIWTDPLGNASTGQVDPALGPAGSYAYVVPGTSGCPNDSAFVQVLIAQPPDAGSSVAVSMCSSAAPIDLFAQLGGTPDIGGAWTAPGGASTSSLIDPAVAVSGTYTYTVPGTTPCANATASVAVTIAAAPEAGDDAVVTWCSSDAAQPLFDALAGTPQSGGDWYGPGGAPVNGLFTPGGSAPGTYAYVIAGQGPCAADTATLTVAVVQAADAGSDGALSGCSNGPVMDLFAALGGSPDANGTWTGPAGTSTGGVIDPATALPGPYTYTVNAPAPCPAVTSTVQVAITAVPAPVITTAMDGACAPVELILGIAAPINAVSCTWDLGNGITSTQCGGDTLLLDVPGSYPIALTIEVANGCTITVQAAAPVDVFDAPTAAFEHVPGVVTTASPTVTFVNLSTGATAFTWDFGAGTSSEVEPTFIYPSVLDNTYTVCLTAFASPTCTDTACTELVVEPSAQVFVPNAFSPDGDGVNDRFRPVVRGVDPNTQHLYLVDRWGTVVYTTDRPEEGWDGTFGDGSPVPVGVLIWRYEGRDAWSGEPFERLGSVTLVR